MPLDFFRFLETLHRRYPEIDYYWRSQEEQHRLTVRRSQEEGWQQQTLTLTERFCTDVRLPHHEIAARYLLDIERNFDEGTGEP